MFDDLSDAIWIHHLPPTITLTTSLITLTTSIGILNMGLVPFVFYDCVVALSQEQHELMHD